MRPRNAGRFDHHYFDIIDRPDKAYWLGFLMADGGVSDKSKAGALQLQVHLAGKDVDHLARFHVCLSSNKKIYTCADGSVRSSHSSDMLCAALIKLGCTPRKSLTLRFPDLIDEMTPHFIRGYFDGDGSASINGTRLFVEFVGTEQFLEAVRSHLQVENKLQRVRNINHLLIGKIANCERIFNYLYDNAEIYLVRKKSVFDRWLALPHPGSGNYVRKAKQYGT